MKSGNKHYIYLAVVALLIAVTLIMPVFASGGPGVSGGSGTASVSGVNGVAFSFSYSSDSTYEHLQKDRTASTDGASAAVGYASNTFTLTAKSSKGSNPRLTIFDKSAQNVSIACDIRNTSGKTLVIGYTYSIAGSGATNGESEISAGSGTLTWLPNQIIRIGVKTGVTNWAQTTSSEATATFQITSCKVETNYDLTVNPVKFGSYTYSYTVSEEAVSGTLTSSGSAHENTVTEGVVLTCSVPTIADAYKDDYYFYGWSINGTVTASNEAYSAAVTTHTSIIPVILKNGAAANGGPFTVNGTRYMFWADAFKAAGASYPVIVAEDYSLPTTLSENGISKADGIYITGSDGALSYQVPENAKLLVPFGSGDDGSFQSEATDNFLSLSEGVTLFDNGGITKRNWAYRTLTVPNGIKIDCYGEINVNGQRQKDGQPYAGVALGGHGRIILGEESISFTEREESEISQQLIIRSGAKLYCYGYITGTGLVEVANGGNVYELLQLCTWPGGSNAFNWKNADHTGFLITQYYVQNIEAALKVNYGGVCYLETVTTQNDRQKTASSSYINTKSNGTGLFLLDSGAYILRIYDQAQDRMNYHLKGGTVDFGSMSVTFEYLYIPYTINSEEYILSLNNSISVYVESGATFNVAKKAAILPGSKVIVKEKGTLNLTNQLYIWDVNDWKTSYIFSRAYADDSYYKSGYTMTNKSPNHNPLPYVATLNGISPNATSFVRLKDGTGETYYMDAINYTESGHLEVNGTLNISGSGSLCTTNGKAVDKNVKGAGTISISSTPKAGSLTAGCNGTVNTITTVAGLGNLAGLGTLHPFGTGNYYGQSNDYWYQYKITTSGEGTVAVTDSNGVATGNSSGEVARVASGGSITFTADGYSVAIGEKVLEDDGSGIYTLSNITENTILTLTAACQHNWIDATCTNPKICSVCSKTEGSALGHTEVTDAAIASTCNSSGLTEGSHCSVCSETLVAQQTIPALGHNEVIDNAVAATCTTPGLTEGSHCSTCGEVNVAQKKVSALGHDYTVAFTWNDAAAPVMLLAEGTEDNFCTAEYSCTRCEESGSAPATVTEVGSTAPTFDSEGNVVYKATFELGGVTYPREDQGEAPATNTQIIPALVAVAKANDTLYTSLAEAIDKVKPDEHDLLKVYLLADTEETISPVNKAVTIYREVSIDGNKTVYTASGLAAAEGYVKLEQAGAYVFYQDVDQILFDAIQLSVEGEVILRLKFYIPSQYLGNENITVSWVEDPNKVVPEQKETVRTGVQLMEMMDDRGRVVLEQGIASGEMASNVTVIFKGADGTELPIFELQENENLKQLNEPGTAHFKQSVYSYSKIALADTEKELNRTLTRAMLTFGGYAQKRFGITAQNAHVFLADESWTPMNIDAVLSSDYDHYTNTQEQPTVAGTDFGITYDTQKVILDSKVTLVTFFKCSEAIDLNSLSNYTFTITYPENGQRNTKTLTAEEVFVDGDRIRVEIRNVPVAYWDNPYTITVTGSDEQTYSVSSTVLGWAKRCIIANRNLLEVNVAKAMFLYNEAANAYFKK